MKFVDLTNAGLDSRYIDVGGLRTHYLDAGEGDPLVLVHGGGAGADAWGNWYKCISRFSGTFRVIALDMPGFGRTEKPSPEKYPYDQHSRNAHLIEFLTKMKLHNPALIGNSMGGATCLGVAIARPDLVRKLILMGAAGLAIANPDPSAIKALTSGDHSIEGIRRSIGVLTADGFTPDEALVLYRHSILQSEEAKAAAAAIGKSKLVYDRNAVASVQTPTLVIGGKDDQIAVLARTMGFLELMKNSWGFILPHCGHWAMIEAAEEFIAICVAFLNDADFTAVPQ